MSLPRTRSVEIGGFSLGGVAPFVLIAGPCVIESRELCMRVAESVKELTHRLGLNYIFKASYDKANRTSVDSFRGPGLEEGLSILAEVKREFGVPVISDVHGVEQVATAAEVLDVIQVPAFLCRQTDLLTAAGKTGKPVNVKKGQFMAPADMLHAAKKIEAAGNDGVVITERGAAFGYNNLVVDMRSLSIIREAGYPVVFDATHSVQLPGGQGACSGGERCYVPVLGRAAAASGVDAIFMEVHPEPDSALCDGANSWPLGELESLLNVLIEIDRTVKAS